MVNREYDHGSSVGWTCETAPVTSRLLPMTAPVEPMTAEVERADRQFPRRPGASERAYAEIDALRAELRIVIASRDGHIATVTAQAKAIAAISAATETAIIDIALATRGNDRVGAALRELSAARAALRAAK